MLTMLGEFIILREVWGRDVVAEAEVEGLGDPWPEATALLLPDSGAEVATAPSVSTSYYKGYVRKIKRWNYFSEASATTLP